MTTSTAAPVAVLIPVKQLDLAKSRLRELGDVACRALVLAMLEDVLDAVRSASVGPIFLLSSEPAYDELAACYGATRLPDADSTYNGAVTAALGSAPLATSERVLIIPADLPTVRQDTIRQLALALEGAAVLLVASTDGGTSALGLRPPGAIAPGFGVDSAATHRRRTAAAGLRLVELALPTLATDVDTPADLQAVAKHVGPATARVLATFGLAPPQN